MQGTIAQIITLTTYGNAYLSGRLPSALLNFYPENSTFKFCEYVRFADLKPKMGGWDEIAYSSDPAAWFSRLKEDGVHTLRMKYLSSDGQTLGDKKISDRMLVGFVGGGGRWLIEAVNRNGSDFWEGRWEIGDRERTDQKIWRVAYGRVAVDRPTLALPADDLIRLKSQLFKNLVAIRNFASDHNLEGFAKAFDAGLSQLQSQEPFKGVYHTDLVPENALSDEAVQLLGAAQAAWVFGGMGSWNDLGFEGEAQELYERLSEELYQLLNAAIIAGVNASTPAIPEKHTKAWWKLWK